MASFVVLVTSHSNQLVYAEVVWQQSVDEVGKLLIALLLIEMHYFRQLVSICRNYSNTGIWNIVCCDYLCM